MSLLDLFKKQQQKDHSSASIAKERLQIIVAHERGSRTKPDYLPQMQKDILAVVRRYVQIGEQDVQINFDHSNDFSILELNVTLPDA